jgi:phosphinothricin acetyltransferase
MLISAATSAEITAVIHRLQAIGMMWRDIDLANAHFFVAKKAEGIIGFVGMEVGEGGALLRSLYVEPEHRNANIGIQLVRMVETEAHRLGLAGVYCFSTHAGGFFLKHGYSQVPVAQAVQRVGHTPQALWYLQRGDELADEIAFAKPSNTNPIANSIALRPATLADAPAITAIYAYQVKHGTASWELTPPSLDEMRKRMCTILEAGYPYLVAEVDGVVLGYSYASSYRPRPGYRFTCENSVYVDPALQRKGIAKLLLSELMTRCAAQGLRQMIAVIGDSHNIASIKLHESLGFVQVGFLPNIGYKFDRWLDSVIMQRAL